MATMEGQHYWVPECVRGYLQQRGWRLALEDMEPHILEWGTWMRSRGDFHDARYNAVGVVPWHDLRESISCVTIDESLAFFERGNMNYWFYGMGKIESVSGLGNLRRIGEMPHTFNSCKGLVELDFRRLDPGPSRRWTTRSARALT